MDENSADQGDVFSWAKFENKMSKLLENVARKKDVLELQQTVAEVKNENKQLRQEVDNLKAKFEQLDKNSRRRNLIFCGINCVNTTMTKTEIANICNKVLKVEVSMVRIVTIKHNSDFLVELETVKQAVNILSNSAKLKNSGIYVQKDYTAEERNKRFHLRQLKNYLKRVSKDTKCMFKNTSLIIDDKRYEWCNGNIVAQNEVDKQSIMLLLVNNANYNVVVKKTRSATTSNGEIQHIQD